MEISSSQNETVGTILMILGKEESFFLSATNITIKANDVLTATIKTKQNLDEMLDFSLRFLKKSWPCFLFNCPADEVIFNKIKFTDDYSM